MCRLYRVTRAGYYAWRSRERSGHERENTALASRIRVVRKAAGPTAVLGCIRFCAGTALTVERAARMLLSAYAGAIAMRSGA